MKRALNFLTRDECPRDFKDVFAIHSAAFATDGESRLVDKVRGSANPVVSLVAIAGERRLNGEVVGHILVSPVQIDGAPKGVLYMALGPMAVRPDCQRRGVGSRLVSSALEACRELGVSAVFVLGHPEYYPRLGFEQMSPLGLYYRSEENANAFFGIEIMANALTDRAGEVHYHPAFDAL